MSDSGDSKYKWTPESTTLLVSVWTDRQVQKQLEYATKPQLIWESVAKYMCKKGYNVTGKQCRTRMKQVLVCYREAKRAGTRSGVEQYYESIDRVLKLKKLQYCNDGGIDTVDSTANVKSPAKEVKTHRNLQMRCKYQPPPESMYRTEALSPVWNGGRDEDYPDSPESNETVLAQPYRVLSPVRDAATNTIQQQLGHMNKKNLHQNVTCEEMPIKETYRPKFSEVPYQNAVQNIQNQIIQESMQQNEAIMQQNFRQNQIMDHNPLQMNPVLRKNLQNINQGLYAEHGIPYSQGQIGFGLNMAAGNFLRTHNCQMNSINNRAMPQEPRKNSFRQNLAATHRQFQDNGLQNYNRNMNQEGFLSPSISPDIPPNLNEAFCQSKNEKDPLNVANADVTTITNNATYNDDSISIEFLEDSPSPDGVPIKVKDFAVNTDEIPNAPFRKKKAEKLERLMMNAINSQNDVVNKILAAQNQMVTRVLDLDRDRQTRLENRLDHLLDVVQTAVLNKSTEKSPEIPPPPPEPLITNLMPPPKPGVIPPKLDLVPPKPCRVPCTVSNVNSQPVNQQAPTMTRPGVISPIMSPSNKVGAIWQKLGPVSTSPFVRAQQQLGFRPIHANSDTRTQSSAERRIVKEFATGMDTKTLIFETTNFLEAERQIEEEVENARIKETMGQELQARRRLFTRREPNAAMVLTAAFLEAEMQYTDIDENARLSWLRQRHSEREIYNKPTDQYKYDDYGFNVNAKRSNENYLAGQADNYIERLRQLNACERIIGDPCDSSTPDKKSAPSQRLNERIETDEPRQTIQQLAQLVMNSARWRKNANQEMQRKDLNFRIGTGNIPKPMCHDDDPVLLRNGGKETINNPIQYESKPSYQGVNGKAKSLNWLQDRFSYGGQTVFDQNNAVNPEVIKRQSYNEPAVPKVPPRPPMGFTAEFSNFAMNNNNNNNRRLISGNQEKRVGFVFDNDIVIDENTKNRFAQEEKDPFEELHQFYVEQKLKQLTSKGVPFMVQNGEVILTQNDIIDRYMKDMNQENKPTRDTDSDNDEEFVDTTASIPSSRKSSLTAGTKSAKSESGCIIS